MLQTYYRKCTRQNKSATVTHFYVMVTHFYVTTTLLIAEARFPLQFC
nr:MAG TPA: hypothetical protein [Caudoviricetes sp.]